MYTPIARTKVFEQIVTQVERQILDGELHTGDYLGSERELAEQFGASRTAVREALKTLAQKGLVDMRPGRGTMIINGTSRAMRHSLHLMMRVEQAHNPINLVEMREILEPEIAALAAARATEDDIAALRVAVQTMDQTLDNADAYIAADNDFHRTLAGGTRNPLILALLDSVVDLLSEQRKLIFAVEGGPERGQVHHKRLLDMVAQRNVEGAHACMRAHMRQVRDDTGRALDAPIT
ncbi:MAG TPA: FadR/GntR family transcriptional regulator [Ktedonobacterales bacterium]|nr:FadR/GntR family transcriptional regulator [Ktedonobacterales bacterium]